LLQYRFKVLPQNLRLGYLEFDLAIVPDCLLQGHLEVSPLYLAILGAQYQDQDLIVTIPLNLALHDRGILDHLTDLLALISRALATLHLNHLLL
jgi:hypothetical protein